MNNLRIIFMGTPEFAVPSLAILLKHGYKVEAVITAPDKPRGRGRKLQPSPVKSYALENGIPVLQPTNLKSPQFNEELATYNANLQVVVAFRMLPEIVWNMPEHGTFNLHASLLPRYRGAAPIHWAIINGETETGVTTFFLKHEIDTGNIILQDKELIGPNDTTGTLYERLMIKGASLVLNTVQLIEKGICQLTPQQFQSDLPKAPKIFKEHCEINWKLSAREINNLVRGLNPHPSAWTEIHGTVYKIHQTQVLKEKNSHVPGSFESDARTYLHFHTGNGTLAVTKLQAPGKKVMNIQDFLRGNKL